MVQTKSIEGSLRKYVAGLEVVLVSKQSSIVDIRIQVGNPKLGIDLLNKLFEVYRLSNLQEKNQKAVKTLDFLENRLRIVKSELDSTQLNIENFRLPNRLVLVVV